MRGKFITFEGTEGGGKSTQIKRTAAYLRRKGYSVTLLREPGGTKVSEAIRRVLLDRKNTLMTPEAELLLYLAARAQVVREKIMPALKKKQIVICDRFEDSTLAYQGAGRNLPAAAIKKFSEIFVRGKLKPDLTVLLDIDPAKGLARGGRHDRMERQSLKFHRSVRGAFLRMAAAEKKRFLVIDALKDKNSVFEEIKKRLDRVL